MINFKLAVGVYAITAFKFMYRSPHYVPANENFLIRLLGVGNIRITSRKRRVNRRKYRLQVGVES